MRVRERLTPGQGWRVVALPCRACGKKRGKTGAAKAPTKPRRNRVPKPFRGLPTSISKLHQRWRDALGLDALGFVPEQYVAGYRCDDVNRERRIIVEVNGDYVHANPAKYAATDKIVMEFARYTAAEKWSEDEKRTERLRAAGWRVLVVWESDDVEDVRACLRILLAAP